MKPRIVKSTRPGGGTRFDIYIGKELVEGGFFTLEAATAALDRWKELGS